MKWSENELLNYKFRNKKIKYDDTPDDGKESELNSKITSYIKTHGLYGFHDRSRMVNISGHPDWVIALPCGRTLWIECKAKKGILSEEQKNNILLLLGLGHEVYEIRSFKRFLEIVNQRIKDKK